MMNPLSVGNITSADICMLVSEGTKKDSIGVPFYTYITECNMERRLGRSLSNETFSKETAWGTLCEQFMFDKLPTSYRIMGNESIQHDTFKNWRGQPDAFKSSEKLVSDIKCPYSYKSFCQLIDLYEAGGIDAIRNGIKSATFPIAKHKDGEKFYWQIVSNSILMKADKGELIVFMPYEDQLEELQDLAQNWDGDNLQFMFVVNSLKSELPHLIQGNHYKNVNHLTFDIPQEDKDFLTERVKLAESYLIEVVPSREQIESL